MNNNPFSSKVFITIWLKHFKNKKTTYKFDFINNITFVKSKFLPIYYNVGKNITNGMSYSLNNFNDFKRKVFLVHDVPSYFDLSDRKTPQNLKSYKIKQYQGYLSDLSGSTNFDEFLKSQFKSNSRYKFKRNQQRLESCFPIKYKLFHSNIPKEDYNDLMSGFKYLIKKRFNALGKDNDVLTTWDYYNDLIYPMLIEKKALLIVIYSNKKPIGVSLSFLSDKVMFYAITSFDTDYYRFNLGHTTIIKLINWCYENGIKTFDFSKGEYEYKTRWTNKEYYYEHHILYDSKYLVSTCLAYMLKMYFLFKQYLREKDVNTLFTRIKYIFKNLRKNKIDSKSYSTKDIDDNEFNKSLYKPIDINAKRFEFLKPIIFDNLYKKPESISNLTVYKSNDLIKQSYIVEGQKNRYKIVLN